MVHVITYTTVHKVYVGLKITALYVGSKIRALKSLNLNVNKNDKLNGEQFCH